MNQAQPIARERQRQRPPTSGSWRAGMPSPNPAGRPTRNPLADAIRSQCNADELVTAILAIARSTRSESLRFEALRFLAEGGYRLPGTPR